MIVEKLIKVPIYDFAKIKVIVTDEVLNIPIVKEVLDEGDDHFKGIVFTKKEYYYVVLNMDKMDKPNSTIPHECAHIVFSIMQDAGIKVCRKSEEAFTYLLGYITNMVYQVYENYLKINAK